MSAGIGQSIRVKGEIVAREPFVVAGHVEGTIEVDQNTLTIADGAMVEATVTADSVIIQGTVKGDFAAVNKIAIQPTARVEGEFTAPTISVAEGAQVHGKVETTTQRKAKLAVAS
jgi:cytoskeletal protein CcmA (bactofilin family)